MLLFLIYTLLEIASGRAVDATRQYPMLSDVSSVCKEVPGNSTVKLCPESQDTDILVVERIINRPDIPYLDGDIDVFVWGKMTRDIWRNSTVDYQINATASTGDFGALNGTFHVCDYIEEMHQPPNASKPVKACPPREGPVSIDYAFCLASWLVAP